MQITKTSIVRPSVVIVVFTLLISIGAFCYTQLNYELMPKISSPIISVNTLYPGASPSEVENSLTRKIEDALSSLEGLKKINSTSIESYSMTIVELEQDADVDLVLQDAQRKINSIISTLPEDAETPSLGKFDFGEMPVIRLGVTANLSSTELFDLVDKKIQPALAKIPGVAQIQLQGGQEREIQVNIDQERLSALGLSVMQVSQAIQSANLDFPTGKIKDEEGQTLIRLSGKYKSLEEIKNLVIRKGANGSATRLKDLAEVFDTQKDATIISRVNGNNAIGLSVQKQSDANAVSVSAEVLALSKSLEEDYSESGLDFTVASDTSEFTLASANAVTFDLMIAILLVATVMLLFLHSIRNAVIVMIAVPASIISTFIAIYLLDYSLNLMTLLALSLVVGILVDDAIVVIENIYRHLELGKKKAQAAYDGIREIAGTVTSITLVIVIVFIPIAMSNGMISNFLKQFSITIAIATLLSLLVSFTLIPLLASRFSQLTHLSNKKPMGRFFLWFESGIQKILDGLSNILNWSFNHKLIVLSFSVILLVGSFALAAMGFIGTEFVNSGDRGEFLVKIELPKNATLSQTNFLSMEVESYLEKLPEVAAISSTVGSSSGQFSTSPTPYVAEISVKMVDKKLRSSSADIFAREAKIQLEERFVGAKFTAVPVSIMGTADEAPIQVVLTGTEIDKLLAYSSEIKSIIAQVEGTAEITSSVEGGNPEVNVLVDREKMADLGLTMDQVGFSLQTAFNGVQDAKYQDGEYDYDISVILDAFDRKNTNDLKQMSFTNTSGQQIRLDQFADVQESTGPSRLERLDRISSMSISAQVLGRPVGTVGTELAAILDQVQPPKGIEVKMAGQLEQQNDAFGSLGFALLASLFFVYLIMVALYDSFVYPLVVMFSVPLSVIGAFLALALAQESLSIFSMLGMIMLIGLVAKNAILVVDFTNQLKKEGIEVKQALIKATQARFRPILMTTLAMVFGMMPIALATGAGAEWKNGLAWVLIGGLTSSMFLTLVVVPVVYYIFDKILARFGWNKNTEIELADTALVSSEIEQIKMAN